MYGKLLGLMICLHLIPGCETRSSFTAYEKRAIDIFREVDIDLCLPSSNILPNTVLLNHL